MGPPQWDTRGVSRISLGFQELWDGIVGLEPSRLGHSGRVQDVPGLPRTLGWDGQWEWSGTVGTCPGCPWASHNSKMGWTVGLELSRVGQSGHVQDVPGLPTTLGWDGQ